MIKKAQGNQTQTDLVKRSLVSYILDAKLEVGKKLPPQAELRRRLGVGNATISKAIDELRQDGVLEVRDKVGVFLLDPNADGHICRNVAVLSIRLRDSMFASILTSFLQLELMKSGCQMNIFCLKQSNLKIRAGLTDLPGLRRSIESGEIQGVIHLDDLGADVEALVAAAGIPALKLGGTNIPQRNGIYFDYKDLLCRAMGRLWSSGVTRPSLLLPPVLVNFVKPDYLELLKRFPGNPKCCILPGYDVENGCALAHEFAAMPPETRPDGIIILDDIVGGGFCSELALLLPPSQLPLGAILRSQQLNISFALPRKVFYDIDLSEYASIICNRIVNDMKGVKPEHDCIYYDLKEDISALNPAYKYF